MTERVGVVEHSGVSNIKSGKNEYYEATLRA